MTIIGKYSRLASKMSTSSQFSLSAASGIAPTSLVPESRPHVDLSGSRQQVDWVRSRRHSWHPLLQVLDGDGAMEVDEQSEDLDVEMEMEDNG